MTDFKIVSWNVNGLRAAAGKGFGAWLQTCGADLVALQEVRARPEQLPDDIREPNGWYSHFVSAQRPGYSGVGLYARRPLAVTDGGLGEERFDSEGRLQFSRFGRLLVINGYFPNGTGGAQRDNSRIPYKLDFCKALFDSLKPDFDAGLPILVVGDWNTAPAAIDLARPKANEQTSGFTPIERAEMRRWLDAGWVDAFRHRHPERKNAYSWWSQRFGVRAKNIGWRIDLALASPGAVPFLRGADIHPEVMGSDHCPISVVLDGAVLGEA